MRALTLAAGTGAPVGSLTNPLMRPVTCAGAGAPKITNSTPARNTVCILVHFESLNDEINMPVPLKIYRCAVRCLNLRADFHSRVTTPSSEPDTGFMRRAGNNTY